MAVAYKNAEYLMRAHVMCELVCIFFRALGLPLTLAALGRLLRSSPPPGSVAPECKSMYKWHCAYLRVAYYGL